MGQAKKPNCYNGDPEDQLTCIDSVDIDCNENVELLTGNLPCAWKDHCQNGMMVNGLRKNALGLE